MRYAEDCKEVGTKAGRVVTWMRIICDTLADLPAPDAYDGITICMGSRAFVIADKSKHSMQSSGQWVDITENDGDYTLPPATSNSLGGIMVGSGLTIDSAGMLSGDFSALWDSIYQTEKHLTGVPPLSFMASGNGIEAAVIYGNGQQTGTPTPSAPIPFDGTGERTGNLFDGDYAIGILTVSGNTATLYTASSGRIAIAKCEPNTTYTVKKYGVSNRFIIAESDIKPVSGTSMSIITPDSSRSEYSFTTSNTTQYVGIYCSTSSEQAEPPLMLNLGSTALPYEPYGYKIPLTCASVKTPIYLGEVSTTRRIKKRVFDGSESWNLSTSGNNTRAYTPQIPECMSLSPAICTHFDYNVANVGYPRVGEFVINSSKTIIFGVDGTTFADVDAWKSYLAQKYAAGTPVTVWYVLAEPETGIVNEPLYRIGDYADELHSTDAGISIQTVRGQNTLTIGTTLQPSKISITYF